MTTRDWNWNYAPRSKVGVTCPKCNVIHGSDEVVAVGRFTPVCLYRTRRGGPLRATRAEAVADLCVPDQDEE